jgi:aryl-alcohol dehydrogenase-like predicted oxidoreductase
LCRKAFSTAGHARSWVKSHLEAGICARHNARSPLPKFRDQDFSMQIRNLGGSGLRVSAVGLGCNNFGQRVDLEGSRKVIHKALDLGITLFDTADIYSDMGGSENVLGAVLGDRRKDIVLATKYSKPMATDGTKQGASRRYIMNAVEASLKRLKTDYIDLYQQHDYDPLTPIEESLRALDDLVRQGKVRYVGNSNFPAWRVAEAEYVARAMNVSRFVSCQDEYSLVVRDIEKDLLPAAEEYNLGLLPFFPLASGLLTGKYKRGEAAPGDTRLGKIARLRDRYVTPRNEEIVEKLQAFAQARGHLMLELAFSWLAARPQVASVIAGATRVEQVEQNVKAIAWSLSADEMKEIDGITL